jgi:hypothetical protein
MAHGKQRSSLSVATGLRRRCSAGCQRRSAKCPRPHEPPRQRAAHRFAQARRGPLPHSRMWVRSPVAAHRGLAAKCAANGFRESLARFRADKPPTSLTSVERIVSRFLCQRGACEEVTSARASLRRNPLPVHRSAVHRQSAHWASSCNVVSSILTPLGRSR